VLSNDCTHLVNEACSGVGAAVGPLSPEQTGVMISHFRKVGAERRGQPATSGVTAGDCRVWCCILIVKFARIVCREPIKERHKSTHTTYCTAAVLLRARNRPPAPPQPPCVFPSLQVTCRSRCPSQTCTTRAQSEWPPCICSVGNIAQ
jgi:hypothetical protein